MSWASKQIIASTMQVWAANQALRDRLGTAGAKADAAGNAAGSTVYAINGDAALWGNPIPITWGRRRITGQFLQLGIQRQQTIISEKPINAAGYGVYGDAAVAGNRHGWEVTSNVQISSETKFYSTFAYCFGAPGSKTATQILTKLWFNGQLVYDIDQGQLSTEFRFKLYPGSEDQIPDSELNKTRYPQPVAYRGMIYIVFYDYSINGQTTSGNPLVEAEFVQQVTNDNSATEYSKSVAISTSFWYPLLDSKKGIIYIFGNNQRIYKYRVSDRVLLGSYPITGLTNESNQFSAAAREKCIFRLGSNVYTIFQRSASNAERVFVCNLDTGVVTGWVGNEDTPPFVQWLTWISPVVQGTEAWIVACGLFGSAYLFKVTMDGAISLIKTTSRSTGIDAGAKGIPNLSGPPTTVYWYRKDLYFNDTIVKTFDRNIGNIEYCPVDNTLVVFLTGAGTGDWQITKISRANPPEVLWDRLAADYPAYVYWPTTASGLHQNSYTAGQRLGWTTGTWLIMLDLITGQIDVTPSSVVTLNGNGLYDAYTNRMIYTVGNSVSSTTNIADWSFSKHTTGNMLLSDFLKDIARMQGYTDANITVENIPDEIVGAAITQVTDLDTMLDDIRRAYNFQIIKTGQKIRFTRRGYGLALEVDGSYTEDQRAVLSDGDGVVVTVESETVAPSQAPGTIVLKYIDPDYNFTVVPFSYKRNDPMADRTVELKLELPIIMTGSDAAALAARALVDSTVAGTTHKFRLPQANLAHEPGDIIELIFDDYTDTVRAVEISYNGDFSLTIDAESMYTEEGPTYPVPDPILPALPPALLGGEGAALIIDSTLIRAEDEQDTPMLESYVSVIAAARLPVLGTSVINRSVDNGQMKPVATTQDSPTYGTLLGNLSVGPVMCVNYDEVIQLQMVQGDPDDFHTDTLLNVLAGKNRVMVGNTGRWEQIGYIEASYDSNTFTVTLTGIIRGLRGTEPFASMHQVGDYALPVVDGQPNMMSDSLIDLNKLATYAISDDNARVNYDDAISLPILGTSRRPWAPYNVHVIDTAGDLAISWNRRTRLTGPLNNGNPNVPLDETDERYQLLLYRAGNIVRTLPELTAPTFTYTAAMQAEDGWTGSITQLQLNVSQISALVGPGFANAGTYDVE